MKKNVKKPQVAGGDFLTHTVEHAYLCVLFDH